MIKNSYQLLNLCDSILQSLYIFQLFTHSLDNLCLQESDNLLTLLINKKKIDITISIGCAPTKSIAKIASDCNKPNGITIVEPHQIKIFLKNLDSNLCKKR